MKPNAAVVDLARRAAVSLFSALLLFASPALAGDRALLDPIGFSPDARYFAFEEYGIQDGSGFAYSNIYVIDLTTDSWVEGTPVRQRADDESMPLLAIRAQAMNEAFATIEQFDIATPAEVVALIGDGTVEPEATSLRFGQPGFEAGTVREERTLALTTLPATSPDDCRSYFDRDPLGFELTISNGDDVPVVLHRDEGSIPKSRGCALDYRLHAVALPGLGATQERGVVIVSVYPGGFEGPDRRFLAVPFAF
jgi:predicted secreted protein